MRLAQAKESRLLLGPRIRPGKLLNLQQPAHLTGDIGNAAKTLLRMAGVRVEGYSSLVAFGSFKFLPQAIDLAFHESSLSRCAS